MLPDWFCGQLFKSWIHQSVPNHLGLHVFVCIFFACVYLNNLLCLHWFLWSTLQSRCYWHNAIRCLMVFYYCEWHFKNMFILHLIGGLHWFNRGRELYSRPAWPNIQHCNLSIFRLACASSVLLSDGISNRMQHCYSKLNSRAFISLSALEYTERETGAL